MGESTNGKAAAPLVKTIRLDDLVLDVGLQIRVKGVDPAHVAELQLAYAGGADALPPGRVFLVDGKYLLTRGFHRVTAARAAKLDALPFEVIDGDRAAARLDAAASNARHGLKRSNDDKRRAVEWTLDACPDWTNSQIAHHCGVGSDLVDDVQTERAAVAAATNERRSNGRISVKRKFGGKTDKDKPKSGRPNKKAKQAADAAVLLKANPGRTDADVATEVGCKPAVVTTARKALIKTGVIPRPPKPSPTRPPTPSEPETKSETKSETKPETPAVPGEHPADVFAGRVNKVCRTLDDAKAEVRELAADPFGRHIHAESVTLQIEAARKALWQSRPTESCNCVKGDKPPIPACKACFGTGRTPASRVLKGGR